MSAPSGRDRLDRLMVQRGLAPTREKARALILAGSVSLPGSRGGRPTPGMLVPADAAIIVEPGSRFVSRGGEKLERALSAFGIDAAGAVALDVGASTGGFTDCLLQAGARRVYGVDVGRGQMDARLRSDPRVVAYDRVNARYPFHLPEPVDLAVVDVSFISARLVIPQALAHVRLGGRAVVLVKPQFEARRGEVGKGGVIRDPSMRARILARFIAWAIGSGLRVRGLTASPITGAEGNVEFLCLLEPLGPRAGPPGGVGAGRR